MNGHLPTVTTSNWREDAINAALEVEARDGSSEDTLLRAIHQHSPGCTTWMDWVDRESLVQFLEKQTQSCQSLMQSHHYHDVEEPTHYFGWYRVCWQETTIEVALPPSPYFEAEFIAFCNDEKVLRDFINDLNDYSIRPRGRSLRYRQGWENAPDIDEEIAKASWDDVVLSPDTLRHLREAIDGFFLQKESYQALGFAWRRGILLVGPPGTGKTMICKALAASTALPFLYVRDLHERNQRDAIRSIFERARKLAPCILAFEDIDGFVNDSNRAVFLNEMDGFQSNEGLLVMASSNHPEKIDEALLKRPSRFDRVFHIGLPDKAERLQYCRKLLSRSTLSEKLGEGFDVEQLAQQVAEKADGFTPAYLKEAFVSAALSCAQQGLTVLDQRFADSVLEQVEELKQYLKRSKKIGSMTAMQSGSDTIGFRR